MNGIAVLSTNGIVIIADEFSILKAKLVLQKENGPPIPTGEFGIIPHRFEGGIYYPGSEQHLSKGKAKITPMPNPHRIKDQKF